MNETLPPTAEYELTPEDWEAVNAAHLFDSPLYRQYARRARVTGFLLFVTLAALCLVLGSASGALLFAFGAIVFPVLLGPLQRHAQRSSLRKLGRHGIAHGTFGHHRVEIRDEGLFHATSAHDTLIRWHAIDEVREKAGHFFVYTGPNAFLPIPVTAFPDSERLRAFADAFYERVEASRETVPGEGTVPARAALVSDARGERTAQGSGRGVEG